MSCMQMCCETETRGSFKPLMMSVAQLNQYMMGVGRRQLSGLNFGRLSDRECRTGG